MATMISPGVYTNIIDLSQYLEEVPGTVAFMPFLSRRGPDNKLVYTTTQQDFAERYGEPKLSDYGKAYGQGPYIVWNHLAVSSNFYTLRCLPDDAQYAHLMVGMQLVETPVDKEKSDMVSRLTLTPIYFDGHKDKYTPRGFGFVGKIKTVDENGKITSVEIEQEGRAYEQDALSIVPSLTTGEGFQATVESVDDSGSIVSLNIDDCGMNYIPQAAPVKYKGEGATAKLNIINGVINKVSVVSGGTGYTAQDVLTIYDEDQANAGNVDAEFRLTIGENGVITDVEVVDGGTGYTGEVIRFNVETTTGSGAEFKLGADAVGTPGNDGYQAAIPGILNGIVSSVSLLTTGQNYNSPLASIETQNGSGAEFTTVISDPGAVTELTVTNSGSGYKNGAACVLDDSTTGGSGLAAECSVSGGSVYKVAITNGGTGYVVGDIITVSEKTAYVAGNAKLVQDDNDSATVTIAVDTDAASGNSVITGVTLQGNSTSATRGFGYHAGTATVVQGDHATATVTIASVSTTGALTEAPVVENAGHDSYNTSAKLAVTAINEKVGAITGVLVTAGGSGYRSTDKLTFTDSSSVTGGFTLSIADGVVRSAKVINGGTGYTPGATQVVLMSASSAEQPWDANGKPRFDAIVNDNGQLQRVDIVSRGHGIDKDKVYVVVKGTGIGAEVELDIVDGAIISIAPSNYSSDSSSSAQVSGSENFRVGNIITIDDVPPGTGAVLNAKVMNGHITDVIISDKDESSGYVAGTYLAARLSQRDVNYPTINHTKELKQFFSDAYQTITHRYMNESTTGGTGVDYGFLMYIRAVGRGDYYNGLSVTLTRNPNPNHFGEYEFAVYEEEEDGDVTQVENFHVSFDPNATDTDGDSMFIEDVINRFSKRIICQVSREALETLDRYKDDFYRGYEGLPSWVAELYPSRKEEGIPDGYKQRTVELARQDLADAEEELEVALQHLADARELPSSTSIEIIERNNEIGIAIAEVSSARTNLAAAKQVLADAEKADIMDFYDIDADTDLSLPIPLKEGSEGSLTYLDKNTGRRIVDEHTADMVLADGYLGLLTKPDNEPKSDGTYPNRCYCDEMLDLDWIYFSIVYEAYPLNVKYAAMELAETYRRDCMLFTDCGDNIDYDDLMSFKGLDWSSRYVARYEGYSKIYDAINGYDIWISPIYHMANIIPMNDLTAQVWFAPAGFNRATINTIKELRWSPKQGERDMLTMAQVNPIVHFPQGYTVWGQKTTQKRPSALQDVNCMRLVLYIKRALENYCKYYIFEMNDEQTHELIRQEVSDFLAEIQSKRGLTDYTVDVGCTDYEFKNKICHVNVELTPMRVIEKIQLNLYIY